MQPRIIYLLIFIAAIVSCAKPAEDSRHRALDILERPPVLTSEKTVQTQEADTSIIPVHENMKGLGKDVYLSTSTPPELILKRPFEAAWNIIGRALKKSDIKITDQERNKGFYYLSYKPSSLFEKLTAFISDFTPPDPYLLRVVEDGEQTKITAALTNAPETSTPSKKETDKTRPTDNSQQLLQQLYEILQEHLKE